MTTLQLRNFAADVSAECLRAASGPAWRLALKRSVFWSGLSRTLAPGTARAQLLGLEVHEPRFDLAEAELADTCGAACTRSTRVNQRHASFEIVGEMLGLPASFTEIVGHCETVSVTVDSGGGDWRVARTMLDAVQGKAGTCAVPTFAGSAAGLLLVLWPGRRTMSASATLMLHPPHQAVFGGAQRLREQAASLDMLTAELLRRLCARTGRRRREVRGWLAGPDVFFTGEQALDCGLVDALA